MSRRRKVRTVQLVPKVTGVALRPVPAPFVGIFASVAQDVRHVRNISGTDPYHLVGRRSQATRAYVADVVERATSWCATTALDSRVLADDVTSAAFAFLRSGKPLRVRGYKVGEEDWLKIRRAATVLLDAISKLTDGRVGVSGSTLGRRALRSEPKP